MSEIRLISPHSLAPSPTAWERRSTHNAHAPDSPSSTLWERGSGGEGATLQFHASDFSNLTPLSPLSARREGGTPAPHAADSPSPTAWERGSGGEGKNPALYRACQEFESLFILQLWRAMQRTLPSQPKTLNYTEMFDVQFADHLAKHGRFGLAEQLYEQLSRHLPKEPTP